MKTGLLAPLFVVALSATACSSSSPAQDPGLSGDGQGSAASAPDANPQGVAYPTDHIGTNPRNGSRAGDRIANYKFLGYPDGDSTKPLQPVSLANYFDPTGTNYKLIHIQASGSWCIHCQNEIKAAAPLAAQLKDLKIVWIVSLAEGGTPGKPSTHDDLNNWVQRFNAPYPQVLDPGNANLGPFYDAAALPWNANISAKTMEILSADVGGIETSDGILKDLQDYLNTVDSPNGLK